MEFECNCDLVLKNPVNSYQFDLFYMQDGCVFGELFHKISSVMNGMFDFTSFLSFHPTNHQNLLFTISPASLYFVTTISSEMVFSMSFSSVAAIFHEIISLMILMREGKRL